MRVLKIGRVFETKRQERSIANSPERKYSSPVGDVFFRGNAKEQYRALAPESKSKNLNVYRAKAKKPGLTTFMCTNSYCIDNSKIDILEGYGYKSRDGARINLTGNTKIGRLENFNIVEADSTVELGTVTDTSALQVNARTEEAPAAKIDKIQADYIDIDAGCRANSITGNSVYICDCSTEGVRIGNIEAYNLNIGIPLYTKSQSTEIGNIVVVSTKYENTGHAIVNYAKVGSLKCRDIGAAHSSFKSVEAQRCSKLDDTVIGTLKTNSIESISSSKIGRLIYGGGTKFTLSDETNSQIDTFEFEKPNGVLTLKCGGNYIPKSKVINGTKKYELENYRAKDVTLDASVTSGNGVEIENLVMEAPNAVVTLEGNSKIKNITFKNGGKVIVQDDKSGVHPDISTVNVVNGEKIQNYPSKGFEKVAGMRSLKQELQDDVIEPLKNPELYKSYGLDVLNGIILYGPPGCGKTYIAKQLAEETGRYFVEITPSNVGSKYQHETAKNIGAKFESAAAHAPSIVFIDEAESLAPIRGNLSENDPDANETVTELLERLDNSKDRGVFVILASNEPQKMDPAIKRPGRADKKIFVGPPDAETRKELFEMELAKSKHKDPDIDTDVLAAMTQNYTAPDITMLMRKASLAALKEGRNISMRHMLTAKDSSSPTLSNEVIEFYRLKGEE